MTHQDYEIVKKSLLASELKVIQLEGQIRELKSKQISKINFNWKRFISFGRDAGKILKFNRYIEARVFYQGITKDDSGWKAYINNIRIGSNFESEELAMQEVEKELIKFREEIL